MNGLVQPQREPTKRYPRTLNDISIISGSAEEGMSKEFQRAKLDGVRPLLYHFHQAFISTLETVRGVEWQL